MCLSHSYLSSKTLITSSPRSKTIRTLSSAVIPGLSQAAVPSTKVNKFLSRTLDLKGQRLALGKGWERRSGKSTSWHLSILIRLFIYSQYRSFEEERTCCTFCSESLIARVTCDVVYLRLSEHFFAGKSHYYTAVCNMLISYGRAVSTKHR